MPSQYFHHPDAPGSVPAMAARAGDFVFYAGGIAADPERGVPDSVHPLPGYPFHWSRINRDLDYVYGVMHRVFEAAGAGMHRILKVNTYLADNADAYEALRVRKDWFGTESPPPSTLVTPPELPVRGARVVTDAVALVGGAAREREAQVTSTEGAPMPPHERIWGYRIYSKAARGGGLIFTSGRTNSFVGGGADATGLGHPDFPYRNDRAVAATRLIMDYLREVLAHWGAGFEHVAKAEIHINDARLIAGIEEVWAALFPVDPPARTFVPVNYPTEQTIIEIELIAVDPDGPYRRETVTCSDAPSPRGAEPQAVRAGPLLFFSGQLATDWKTGVAPEARVDPAFPFHESPVKKQARCILANVDKLCRAAGASGVDLVRRRALHVDLADAGAAEAVWREALGDRVPPTTMMRVLDALPVPGCLVQYDLVGYLGS